MSAIVYGSPPPALASAPAGAVQVSPLVPGSAPLEDLERESLDVAVIAAPPGTLERRYVLALALRALRPGGALTAVAPKDKGGSRLGKELEAFGCEVVETGRQHQRIVQARQANELVGLDDAIAQGGPQAAPRLGLWSQPGVFSWDRPDPGSGLLVAGLPALSGRGGDLGCGVGVLARAVLTSPAVSQLDLVDIDGRAVAAARRNVEDPRARFHWADARRAPDLADLDFVVMNPPFHDAGAEDRELGRAFIRRAHQVLRRGGALWLVANRHLPYEAVLAELFSKVALKSEAQGFKVYEARK
ncbi:class I SAM-dependent methyltransferase [Phenylobacterium sp.]|uniref:class I SAM-dependent methyltransferase n=1 Tax=Phenylobacterium sp. TaxID=1871053 RepID=UPI002C461B8F|nr:class I SAM-dependent methyltransferase [Phenylobacterium sp.]HVI33599.1 class I SAM-dependent methyltransferase [Phenylobacterium sp.]